MYGAMFGDYVGSIYEFDNIKTKDFPLYNPDAGLTDDSYMTIAVASACLSYADHRDLDRFSEEAAQEMRRIGDIYPWPKGGYGRMFSYWLDSPNPRPYGSFGNGAAMRVSPCGLTARSLSEALELARASAMPTHNHPEGIKGARATAAAVYLACHGHSKDDIRKFIRMNFYPLDQTLDEIRPDYEFDGSCQGTVPQAIEAFLESTSFEDAIRNAISIGGDSDTIGAITGSIAEAYYGMPPELRKMISDEIERRCCQEEQDIVARFRQSFCKQLCSDDRHGENPGISAGK